MDYRNKSVLRLLIQKIGIVFLMVILSVNALYSQKYKTKTGKVHFEASVPLFEDVDATNNNVAAVLNVATGDIASVSHVKNYIFKVTLMQEHFNENFAESDKYPKVTFSGKITDFKWERVNEAPQEYNITGTLNFHGESKNISSTAVIFKKNNRIFISGKFQVKPSDFKITIPKILTKKVAERVNVEYNFELVQ